MKVMLYLRVSGLGQVDGDGPARQRDACVAFCKAHGLEVVSEFFDEGVSGTVESLDRPAFSNMLMAIESRRVNGEDIAGFVAESATRIARELVCGELLLRECRDRDIKVFTADRDLIDLASDEQDPTRVLIRQILGALAGYERSQIVSRTYKARLRIRSTGARCEGRKPYGSRPGEKETLDIINALHDISDNGKVRALNDAGLRMRNGKPWTRGMILHLRKQLAKGKVSV